jgi:hypothetical protein
MTDKPILFSAPMVRALLDGTKTQTRRVLKPPYGDMEIVNGEPRPFMTPIWMEDRLWVKESWRTLHANDCLKPSHLAPDIRKITYEADPERRNPLWAFGKLRPSIFMPRWASRLTLTVTDARVQRLQDMNRGDAMDEGCPFPNMADGPNPLEWYADLWDYINGDGAWESNPFVAVYTFTVQRGNIDAVAK